MAVFGDPRLPPRFWTKVQINEATGCWEWVGALGTRDYGSIGWNKRVWLAHRLAYTLLVGSIPPGLVLDHLCRVHKCVNPLHLEAVTQQENIRRGLSPSIMRAKRQSHCNNGHEFTLENTYTPPSKNPRHETRQCRACNTLRSQRKANLRPKPEGN